MKEKSKKKSVAVPILKTSAVKDYFVPQLTKIATEIKADDPKYIPECRGVTTIVKSSSSATLPHRATTVLDCGFSFKLPTGWKVELGSIPALAEKGLIVSNPGVYTDGRLKVCVTNVGKQIIVIKPGDDLAQLTVGPLYLFDWVTTNA